MSNLTDKDALDEMREIQGIGRLAESLRGVIALACDQRVGRIHQALQILDGYLDDALSEISNLVEKCEMDITRNEQARAREDA